jgi:hypothetical protein
LREREIEGEGGREGGRERVKGSNREGWMEGGTEGWRERIFRERE